MCIQWNIRLSQKFLSFHNFFHNNNKVYNYIKHNIWNIKYQSIFPEWIDIQIFNNYQPTNEKRSFEVTLNEKYRMF